ncbi:hypothetical protein GCM10028791_08530 [Echinicola sediminis]
MKKSLIKYLPFLFLMIFSGLNKVFAQQEAFIYGEVELRDESRYKGKITWSAGQSLWVDLLVVEKKDNTVLQYLKKEDLDGLSADEKKTDWGFMALWKNQYPSRKLTFRSQFGHLKEILITGDDAATVVLKNHENIRVFLDDDPEYKNQLGNDILVQLDNGEKKRLKWASIERIRFQKTPSKLPNFDITPLYGKILTRTGFTYNGLIKWDLNEHLSSQYLDGITIDDRRARYHFYDVHSIRPKNMGSLIQLQSGKEIYLHEFTNVTNKNEGILIRNPGWGQISLKWGDFKNAEFVPYPANSGFGYDDFPSPKELTGTVTLKDKSALKGALFFDLDEHWDIETLDGWGEGGGLRQVPFRLIDRITPVSSTHTAVYLTDGRKIVLGDRSDVNEQNWGIMVRTRQGQFRYVPWHKVLQIALEH